MYYPATSKIRNTQLLMKFPGMMLMRTNNFVQSVTLLKYIWEVLGSNSAKYRLFWHVFGARFYVLTVVNSFMADIPRIKKCLHVVLVQHSTTKWPQSCMTVRNCCVIIQSSSGRAELKALPGGDITTWFPRKEGVTPSDIQCRVSAKLWTEGTCMQHRVRLGAELRQWQGDRTGPLEASYSSRR